MFSRREHATTATPMIYHWLEYGFIKNHTDVMRLGAFTTDFMMNYLKKTCRMNPDIGSGFAGYTQRISYQLKKQKLIKNETGLITQPNRIWIRQRTGWGVFRKLDSDFIFITKPEKRAMCTYP